MAKTCRDCGSQSRDVDHFCAACGTTLAGVPVSNVKPTGFCTGCGAPLATADRFCGRCGQPIVPDDRDRTQPLVSGGGLFEGWDREPPPPAEEPRTESIPMPATRRSDTGVLPVQSDPYLRPRSPADRPVEVLEPPEPVAGAARPAPQPRAERPTGAFPWGASLALLGAVAVVIAALLPWTRGGGLVLVPRDLPFRVLISPGAAEAGRVAGPSLGIMLLVAGVVGALVALLTMVAPFLRFLRRLIGLLTLVVPILFVIRLATAGGVGLDALPGALGAGVYVAAAGSVVQIVAGRWFRR